MVIDWNEFYESSVRHCWKYKTLREKVDVAVFEIYGKEYRDEVVKRLDFIFENKEK